MTNPPNQATSEIPRVDLPTRSASLVITAACVLMIPVGLYAFRGLAVLFVVAALAAFASWLFCGERSKPNGVFLILFAFAAWALISVIWSITPQVTIKTGISLVLTTAGAYFLIDFGKRAHAVLRKAMMDLFVWGCLVGFAVLVIDAGGHEILTMGQRPYLSTEYWNAHKPGLTIAASLLWPWATAARDRLGARVAIIVSILIAIVLLMSGSNASRLTLMSGAVVVSAYLLLGRKLIPALAFAVVIIIIVSPLIVTRLTDPRSAEARYDHFPPSAIHRILIWQVAASNIANHPILGHGYDSSRNLPDAGDKHTIAILPNSDRGWSINSELLPLHPHDFALQIWVELGGVGALIAAAFLTAVLYAIRRRFAGGRAMAMLLGTYTSLFAIALVSYGAWQSWWLATIIMVAYVCTLVAPKIAGEQNQDA